MNEFDEDKAKGRGFIESPRSGDDYFHNGLFCEKENRGRHNKSQAYPCFYTAAKKHHIGACFKVGEYLLKGVVRKADPRSAISFYREAAEAGHVGAIERMIKNASKGVGMQKDLDEALRWAEKGAALDSAVARSYLDSLKTASAETVSKNQVENPKTKEPADGIEPLSVKDEKTGNASRVATPEHGLAVALLVRSYLSGDKATGARGISDMLKARGGEYNERLAALYAQDAETVEA